MINRHRPLRVAILGLSLQLFSTLLVPGPTSRPGDRPQPEAVQDFHRRLAYYHAPINFQDTEIRGESQDQGNQASVDQPLQRQGDYMIRFDFDQDWNGLNNWSNFAKPPPEGDRADERARAHMYYSVVETGTHYFISYCSYHAQDREPRCTDSECHENDLEGGLHMVRKGPENEGMGTLWLMTYLAHDYWFAYLTPAGRAAGIRQGGKPPHETPEKAQHYNERFIYDVVWRGITPNGTLFVPADPHRPSDPAAPPGTVFHPTTWQEPWGHGMYGWPGPQAQPPYDKYRTPEHPWKNGFINGDGVIYFPGGTAGIPDYRKGVDVVPYALIDLFEPGSLWERREQIDWNMDGCGGGPGGAPNCTWGYFGAFRGERWGTDKANAPWRWDHDDDHLPPGSQAFDPLRLIEEFNNLSAVARDHLSRRYVNNRYVAIPEGTRPGRPRPTADAGTRTVVVGPGEPFTLDATRSSTGDLNGKGSLRYRWQTDADDWGEQGWDQPWLVKTLSREGAYRVKLTVNDGDHEADDQVLVVVTSNKLFFDDFQSPSTHSSWRLTGQSWRLKEGLLTMRRPGAGLNVALAVDRAYPMGLTLETLMRLDLLYPEAREPFGVGVSYPNAAGGPSAVLFGFVGTRRIDSANNPDRKHMTEVAFYEVSRARRVRLGDRTLTFDDAPSRGYQLGRWYHVKLKIEGGIRLQAKVWSLGAVEPDLTYQHSLDQMKLGAPVPLLAAGTGTNGEAAFDYLLVTSP